MDPAQEPLLSFTCPRCRAGAQARFYGPCPACRAQLAATQAGRARAVGATRFEPTMHVVPNQVATKD